MTQEDRELYRDVMEVWGEVNQTLMAIEEMAELTVELCHHLRGRPSNIPEEIADVQITVEQMQLKHGWMQVPLLRNAKIERLRERMEKHIGEST